MDLMYFWFEIVFQQIIERIQSIIIIRTDLRLEERIRRNTEECNRFNDNSEERLSGIEALMHKLLVTVFWSEFSLKIIE